MSSPFGSPSPDAAVYVISVAAELTGLHPQTLRAYERMGLIAPGRTGGGGRRYSHRDLERLREIADLTSAGIGIEGVRRIMELEHQIDALRARNEELVAELDALLATLPEPPKLADQEDEAAEGRPDRTAVAGSKIAGRAKRGEEAGGRVRTKRHPRTPGSREVPLRRRADLAVHLHKPPKGSESPFPLSFVMQTAQDVPKSSSA